MVSAVRGVWTLHIVRTVFPLLPWPRRHTTFTSIESDYADVLLIAESLFAKDKRIKVAALHRGRCRESDPIAPTTKLWRR